LKNIMPDGEDLPFLAHVRRTRDERAVVICNRLPKLGSPSVVHLVSVEGRYKRENNKIVLEHQGVRDEDSIRLVSLKSWRFGCVAGTEEKQTFTELLTRLIDLSDPNCSPSLTIPFRGHTGTPPATNDAAVAAGRYLAMGCVPLPHAMRQGNKTVSWYRGPLVPGKNTTKEFPLPIRTADQLVYYDDTYGMFDVSYAAAWELGRLLALQSKTVSIGLYRWKRTHARKLKDAETQLAHLPFDGPSADLELPEAISSWFERPAGRCSLPLSRTG
jgi:hypothetical protein